MRFRTTLGLILGSAMSLVGSPRRAVAEETNAPVKLERFQVYQYVVGEKADARAGRCAVPVSASLSLKAYAQDRWAGSRVRVISPEALRQTRCAVSAFGSRSSKGLLYGGLGSAVAAVRWGPDVSELSHLLQGRQFVAAEGWPPHPRARPPLPSSVLGDIEHGHRLALMCWPHRSGWPRANRQGSTATLEVTGANACEWWLLPIQERDQPALDGIAYRVRESQNLGAVLPSAWGRDPGADEAVLVLRSKLAEYLGLEESPEPAKLSARVDEKGANASEVEIEITAPAASRMRSESSDVAVCRLADPRAEATRPRLLSWARSLDVPVEWTDGGELRLSGATSPRACSVFDILVEALEDHLGCSVSRLEDACSGA